MTAQEIKDIIKDIPLENWMTSKTTDDNSKCCVIGHIYRVKHNNGNYKFFDKGDAPYDNIMEFDKEINKFLKEKKGECYCTNLFEINDRKHPFYEQETPKERVLALLDDMIENGY